MDDTQVVDTPEETDIDNALVDDFIGDDGDTDCSCNDIDPNHVADECDMEPEVADPVGVSDDPIGGDGTNAEEDGDPYDPDDDRVQTA